GIDAQRVVEVEVVVEARGEQVVCAPDRVDVPGEVEIDRVRRNHLGAAAAGPPALDAETRPDRRLAKGDDRPTTDPPESLAEAARPGPLSVVGWRRGDGRDDHGLPRRRGAPGGERLGGDLRDLAAIGNELVLGEANAGGDLRDGAATGLGHGRNL